ncbi:DUF1080 domain-containing protein [Halobacteria archaeon AArc-dxtr1]|nr:DUF1080 domain-containing protein [Halobacteria archaeon AArc-dxtr1]
MDDPETTDSNSEWMQRRRILQTVGGLGALSIAGCLGDDDGDDEPNGDDSDDTENGNGEEQPWDEYDAPPEDEWPERVDTENVGLGREPPANATILWDGDTATLDQWEHSTASPMGGDGEDGDDAMWVEEDDHFEVNLGTGEIRPEWDGAGGEMGDCHLHIEWMVPEWVGGDGQSRGNSGVFMMERYEIQVLDNYENETSPGNEAGSYYATEPTLAMPARPQGEWQEFDIIWRGPRSEDGELIRYPQLTVFFNGVCVKNHFDVPGPNWAGIHPFDHDQHGHHTGDDGEFLEHVPFYLQDHMAENDMAYFRNIWFYDLPEEPVDLDDPDGMPMYDSAHGEEFPEMVDPGGVGTTGDPPGDADVLIDGEETLAAGDGGWESDDEYGDCQVHVEWQADADADAMGPWRSNSGLQIGEYEIQILDTHDNPVDAEEWAGAYTDHVGPYYDAVRESGEWQALDVVFQGPRDDGPAQITALLNGIVVQSRLRTDEPNAGDEEESDRLIRLAEPPEDGSDVSVQNTWIRSLE